jgi:hypothetical protein
MNVSSSVAELAHDTKAGGADRPQAFVSVIGAEAGAQRLRRRCRRPREERRSAARR